MSKRTNRRRGAPDGARLRVDTLREAEAAAERIEDLVRVAPARGTGVNQWIKTCPICKAPERRAMNESILMGLTYRKFVARWGEGILSLPQYMRHRRIHIFQLIRGLGTLEASTSMLKIMRFPMDGTAYEQADFCVKQIGYMLDQRRFGKLTDPTVAGEYEGVRKDCIAILKAIDIREKFRGEVPVGEVVDEDERALLQSAQRLIDEQEREDQGGDDQRTDGTASEPTGDDQSADAAVGQSGGSADDGAGAVIPEVSADAERYIDLETLGDDAPGTGGDAGETV